MEITISEFLKFSNGFPMILFAEEKFFAMFYSIDENNDEMKGKVKISTKNKKGCLQEKVLDCFDILITKKRRRVSFRFRTNNQKGNVVSICSFNLKIPELDWERSSGDGRVIKRCGPKIIAENSAQCFLTKMPFSSSLKDNFS